MYARRVHAASSSALMPGLSHIVTRLNAMVPHAGVLLVCLGPEHRALAVPQTMVPFTVIFVAIAVPSQTDCMWDCNTHR